MIRKGKHFWVRIKNSKSIKNLSSLLTGNLISVLIPVLISPILTRLFTESDFGLLTVFNSILAISLTVATGRFDYAILEAKTKSIASHLFILSVLISSIAAFFTTLLGIMIIPYLEHDDPFVLYMFLGFISFTVLIGAITQSIRYLLNREEEYKELAIIKVVRSSSTGSFQLLAGFFSPSSLALIIGKVLGEIAALIKSTIFVIRNNLLELRFSRLKVKYIFEKFSKYYKVNSLHALLSTLSANLLPILFALLFSIKETGYYGLSFRVCVLPITIISHAIFQFYSREFAKKVESEQSSKNMFTRMLKILFSISLVPFLLLIILGPQLFGFVFGENWSESGVYAQILAPYMLMVFLVSPFTFVPIRLDKHVKSFTIEIVNTVFRLAGLLIGAQFSVYVALGLYSLVGFATQGYLLYWIYTLKE